MKSIQRCFVLAALSLVSLAGCQGAEATSASEPEAVDQTSEELFEASCTTASSFVSKTVTGTAPTSCGTFQDFSATSAKSYNTNPNTCPYQFVVEVGRANNTAIGSGYYYMGAPSVGDIVTGFADQTDCLHQQTSYAVWSFSGGAWSEVGDVWLKGSWNSDPDPNTLFRCTWASYASSGSLATVPASATKLRIAAARWVDSGTKGADGADTYRQVVAGIGAGISCPPR